MIEQDTTANGAEGRTTISRREAFEALHRARVVLEALERQAESGACTDDGGDALAHGRAAEALEHAGDAVFNALNVLASYTGDGEAADTTNAWCTRDKIAVEPKAGE